MFGLAFAFFLLSPTIASAESSVRHDRVIKFTRPGDERLSVAEVKAIFLQSAKVADWVGRYPKKSLTSEAIFDSTSRTWKVRFWSGHAGEIAEGTVDDASGVVTEAFTGPQVAWGMARGRPGAFGGKEINSLPVWLAFCAVFLIGLGDFRRPLSLRNLDLLVLLSFSASLWYFNQGRIFTSVPLVYPPLLYLGGRLAYIGLRGRPVAHRPPVWPIWLLAAAAVFLLGFRIGLNVRASNVIDVGYAGVIGAERVASGESPYGHFPADTAHGKKLKPCSTVNPDGKARDYIQPDGRCESVNPQGDTYGPVAYLSYLPGLALFGWSHLWDSLPAVHFTSIFFDVLSFLGLALVGLRFGGTRLAATLAFAWTAYPFTQYVSNSNSNDALVCAYLIWGFWLVSSPWARGAAIALSGWTKFTSLVLAPLWAAYPDGLKPARVARYLAAFCLVSLAAFSVLALEPNLAEAARTFWDRTLAWQLHRESPFSIWDWRQYHAGLPDLHWLQMSLTVVVAVCALALAYFPRRRSPLQLAALSGFLLIAFEFVMTHWFYLYIVWFFPFAAITLLAGGTTRYPDERSHA